MALSNTTNPEKAAAQLGLAIERRVDGASNVRVADVQIPQASGLSNETVLFEATWDQNGGERHERLVARVQPSGPAVFPRYDLGLEFSVMQALERNTDVPVPGMLFTDDDPSLLGAPFIVMRRVDGRVPSDDPPFTVEGWVLDLSDQERERLAENAVQVLARLHAVDVDAAGLGALRAHPEAGIDGQLAFWRETLAWAAEGDANPTVEAGLDWLEAHAPDDRGDAVLSWGDARVGNMIFDDDLSVAAVLDWEMVAVAPAGLDVGWWLFLLRHHTEGVGAPLPAGFPSREAFVARYEELTGTTLADLHFWEVFAAVRLSALMHRAGNLMITAGLLPPDAPMKLNNPASQLLAKLLELPAPEGVAQSFIGNRG
jgi:aminoglycoside phosphotransferase (APT) family kinase protein